jgi:hypothetical protein
LRSAEDLNALGKKAEEFKRVVEAAAARSY